MPGLVLLTNVFGNIFAGALLPSYLNREIEQYDWSVCSPH